MTLSLFKLNLSLFSLLNNNKLGEAMPYSLDFTPVDDLNSSPQFKPAHAEKWITIGDMHANPLKFIYALTLQGAADFSELYPELQACYSGYEAVDNDPFMQRLERLALYKKSRNSEFVRAFRKLCLDNLSKITVNRNVKVRLLGDLLADRGKHDGYIYALLEFLDKAGITYEIIFSNHDAQAVSGWMTRGIYQEEEAVYIDDMNNQGDSYYYGMKLEEPEEQKKFQELYDGVYEPKLKLFSYELQGNDIIIYSHAPITLSIIKRFAEILEFLPADFDSSPQQISKLIDGINAWFSKIVKNKELFQFYTEKRYRDYHDSSRRPIPVNQMDLSELLVSAAWARGVDPESAKKERSLTNIIFVHGHVGGYGMQQDNYKNLDQDPLGKALDLSAGSLVTFVSDVQPRLQASLTLQSNSSQSAASVPQTTAAVLAQLAPSTGGLAMVALSQQPLSSSSSVSSYPAPPTTSPFVSVTPGSSQLLPQQIQLLAPQWLLNQLPYPAAGLSPDVCRLWLMSRGGLQSPQCYGSPVQQSIFFSSSGAQPVGPGFQLVARR